jgi:hypothetical protein
MSSGRPLFYFGNRVGRSEVTVHQLMRAYVDLYEAIEGVSDEMSPRDLRLMNDHHLTYSAIKEQLGR